MLLHTPGGLLQRAVQFRFELATESVADTVKSMTPFVQHLLLFLRETSLVPSLLRWHKYDILSILIDICRSNHIHIKVWLDHSPPRTFTSTANIRELFQQLVVVRLRSHQDTITHSLTWRTSTDLRTVRLCALPCSIIPYRRVITNRRGNTQVK